MNDAEERTKQTYEESAQGLADYFKGIGSRDEDIERAFNLVQANSDSFVLELGCGDGRDAQAILTRTNNLVAFDYSSSLIEIAKETNPNYKGCFMVNDVRTFTPDADQKFDVIFAFASLLHIGPSELEEVVKKYLSYLSDGGVFYISMKKSERHKEVVKDDAYGWRLFHLYHPDEILAMTPEGFSEVYRAFQTVGNTDWFTQALQRKK